MKIVWGILKYLAFLVVAVIFIGFTIEDSDKTSNLAWSVPRKDGTVTYIHSKAIQHDGTSTPQIWFACSNSELFVQIDFGKTITNSYQGTQYTLANIASRIDEAEVKSLGFSMVPKSTALRSTDLTSLGGGIKGIGVGIDNLIFNAFGIKNRPKISWTPAGLAKALTSSQTIAFRAKTARGVDINAIFSTTGFSQAYYDLPLSCRDGVAHY